MLQHNSTISSVSEEEQQLQQKKLSIEEELLESILLPLEYPDAKVWNEILIHGCPGVGKTYLTKKILTDERIKAEVIYTQDHDFKRSMQEVFEKAKLSQPSIIVIDDLEFCDWNSNSEKEISVLKEFLQSMYDRESRVIVLVISSTPWNINPAVRKIFKRRFHIPLPDKEKRIEILRDAFRNSSIQDDEMEEISTMCDGYSYADLMCVVRDSQMNIIRNALMATNNSFNISLNALSQPTKSDVIKSLQTIKSSITIQEEAKHLQFQQDFYPGSPAQFY